MLSFVITAVVCGFTALCYAEFASMVPISGSAYTYSYATLGELVAWIIGWDLIIEYAVGNVAVAISWANYFRTLLHESRHRRSRLARDRLSLGGDKCRDSYESAPHIFGIRSSSTCSRSASSRSSRWCWSGAYASRRASTP